MKPPAKTHDNAPNAQQRTATINQLNLMNAIRDISRVVLVFAAVLSGYYLCAYGRAIVWRWEANEWSAFDVRWLDEISVWFYRKRDEAGRRASPYRLSRHLSVIDPLDGPNWEIRIPGWIPAIVALCILAVTTLSLCGGRRERD